MYRRPKEILDEVNAILHLGKKPSPRVRARAGLDKLGAGAGFEPAIPQVADYEPESPGFRPGLSVEKATSAFFVSSVGFPTFWQ